MKILDYRKQENHLNGLLVTYGGTNQGVKNTLFCGKHRLELK